MNRAAGRFPWEQAAPGRAVAVRPPVVELGTALLFVLAALRFELSWELPAFLFLAAAGVLLAVIDLQHRLLPNRVVVPALGIAAALLLSRRRPSRTGRVSCGPGSVPSSSSRSSSCSR